MPSFSQVPINQTSLSGLISSFTEGSGVATAANKVDFTQFIMNGSGLASVPIYVAPSGTSGGSGVTYPTIGQLYPYI